MNVIIIVMDSKYKTYKRTYGKKIIYKKWVHELDTPLKQTTKQTNSNKIK